MISPSSNELLDTSNPFDILFQIIEIDQENMSFSYLACQHESSTSMIKTDLIPIICGARCITSYISCTIYPMSNKLIHSMGHVRNHFFEMEIISLILPKYLQSKYDISCNPKITQFTCSEGELSTQLLFHFSWISSIRRIKCTYLLVIPTTSAHERNNS